MGTYTGQDKRLKYLFENGGGGGGSANIWTGTLAEYEQQASQIQDGTQVNITDDEIQSLVIASYDIYSFQEREVGVYVDGKPLYQKTIDTGALPNNTTKTVNHGISNIDTVVTALGSAKASGINWIPLPFVNNTSYTDQVALFVNPTTIALRPSGDRSAYSQSYVTIQYTKTTDVAGSGMWLPDGTPSTHYSTDEQVFGTWIDGRTIYRKTFTLTSAITIASYTWTSLGISASGIDMVIDGEFIRIDTNGKIALSYNVDKTAGYVKVMNLSDYSLACSSGSIVTLYYVKPTT